MKETRVNRLMAAAVAVALLLVVAQWGVTPALAIEKECVREGNGRGPSIDEAVIPVEDDLDIGITEGPEIGNFEWGLEYNMWQMRMETAQMACMASFTRFCWTPPCYFGLKMFFLLQYMHDLAHYHTIQFGFNRNWCTLSGLVSELVDQEQYDEEQCPDGAYLPVNDAKIILVRKRRNFNSPLHAARKVVAVTLSNSRSFNNYKIKGLKRGRYIMKVTREGYDDYVCRDIKLRRRRNYHDVVLTRELLPATMSGVVSHINDINGYNFMMPLPGIEVTLEVDPEPLGGEIIYLTAMTDVEGSFIFDEIPPGEAVLLIDYPGYTYYEEVLWAESGAHIERNEIILYPVADEVPVAELDDDAEQGQCIDEADTIDEAFDFTPVEAPGTSAEDFDFTPGDRFGAAPAPTALPPLKNISKITRRY